MSREAGSTSPHLLLLRRGLSQPLRQEQGGPAAPAPSLSDGVLSGAVCPLGSRGCPSWLWPRVGLPGACSGTSQNHLGSWALQPLAQSYWPGPSGGLETCPPTAFCPGLPWRPRLCPAQAHSHTALEVTLPHGSHGATRGAGRAPGASWPSPALGPGSGQGLLPPRGWQACPSASSHLLSLPHPLWVWPSPPSPKPRTAQGHPDTPE